MIDSLKLPDVVKDALKSSGISELNPPQKMTVEKGLMEGKNLVVASPTASGKTLIAELAILRKFLASEKSVYLCPLKALASEKYEELKEKYGSLGMRIAISTGDFDSADDWLGRYDVNVIVLSNEKMDSLLRRGANWLSSIKLIVADEVHLINDASRGPTLEVVLTKLRQITNAQILALSATIKNSDEMARWLGASLVESDYRPIKLEKGVSYPDGEECVIDFIHREDHIEKNHPDDDIALCGDTLKKKKQALVFVSTRRSAEAVAEKIAKSIKIKSSELEKLADEVENVLSSPTKQCRRLASIVRGGAAFHHAGLVEKQRKLIESSFRSGLLKFIVATPTLAFGVNLPAYRVIIRDAKRFSDGYGSSYLPVFEIQQMMGRAGRPKYDSRGEAVIIGKTKKDAQDLKERYILGELEPIYSKLSAEPVLRMHVLALIANETARTKKDLASFFSQTFFGHQYGDIDDVMRKVERILNELESYNFITVDDSENEFRRASAFSDTKLKATRIGKRVAQLYIDPLSAKTMADRIDEEEISFMTVVNQCTELRPSLRVKKTDNVEERLMASGIVAPDAWDIEYEEFLSAFKTSLMFMDWCSEKGEDALLEKYGITPGELYAKTTKMEWMLYSAKEIALLMNKKTEANKINKLRLRIKYGVKAELLPLVELRGIGRARARLLFKNGIKVPKDVIENREKAKKLLGPKVSEQLFAQLDEDKYEKFQRLKQKYKKPD